MNKRTKELQFSTQTKQELLERDKGCFFCQRGIHMIGSLPSDRSILDPMHIVNKSQGGLGVLQNGVIGCRWHHTLLDNSSFNEEMRTIAENYLEVLYPGWTRESVTYKKYKDLIVYRNGSD